MSELITSQFLAHDQEHVAICHQDNPNFPIFEIPKVFIQRNLNLFLPTQWSLKNFYIGRHIGKGGFGHIYLAKERRTGYVVALKVQFKKQLMAQGLANSVLKQIQIQTHMNHPNIVKMYGFFFDKKRIYQIIQYVNGGELYAKLKKTNNGFDEKTSARYILQFMDALSYLHQQKILHRDIKPQNILLDSNDNIKLADFGFATQVQHKLRRSFVGTTDYLAPEIIRYQPYNQSVDIWSLGVLAYQLNSGEAPFAGGKNKEVQLRILKTNYTFPQQFSQELKDFVSKILLIDPKKRMSLEDARKHPWILKNTSSIL